LTVKAAFQVILFAPGILIAVAAGSYISGMQDADMSYDHFLRSSLTIASVMFVFLIGRKLWHK
jgi:hypothetical protein